MIEKKKARASMHAHRKEEIHLHNPMTSRSLEPLTTRKKNVISMWIRKNEPACYETNKSQIGSSKSNGLGSLIASCISNCLVMLRLRIAFLHWAPPKALYRSAVRTAPIERCSDLIDLIGRCWVAVGALYVARYRALYVQRHSVSS
ncbi:hypothetical protein Q3G72_022037 [Acer saccharum]|nr:hypothetical protein Q3G72_022037 [Acer saccharum]